ncbi:MAG: hypothetical protein JWN84_2743 [Nocardioides sp.]|nr:hypothetical protein [Nocardioides sp.]
MPSRTPGAEPDPAAELLGRWQAHHAGTPEPSADAGSEEPTADAAPAEPGAHTGDEGAEATSGPADSAPLRPRHSADPRVTPGHRRTPSAHGSDQVEAGREVVEALGIPAPPSSDPEPEPEPVVETPRRRRTADEPDEPDARSTDVVFAPRVIVRRVVGLLLLALVPATAAAGYLAYDQPRTLTVGMAGVLVVLTLVLYAVRVGSTPVRLAIRSGQLEVVRGSSREVFDLTSRFTRLEVVGRPGRRGWKVLMARFGRDPLVIDSTMVDPVAFTAALERHRPGTR